MNLKSIRGDYRIVGTNQNDTGNTYTGTLNLDTDAHNRVVATWLINNTQTQTGIGFYKDNILVINFQYLGENNTIYKGVVVYKCLTKNFLDGFWYEDLGDPNYLGSERCFKINELKNMLN
ncbi:hypothetical protein KFZ70_00655 [Tamlana fucoidanivorans]|uniref:Uncharacterized protein n=1 Tax=Allotamlana fucoidanivorans TaxID=2583814 RepID=A0A5C4SMS3_9FLAO|nr:hypothetical protein [Tamlana fucoidanivorans]TNJ44525.1 hypothetical protein FGF67_07720 [Tamlana fucoidanivorans]